jgi:hypothetical protein
MVILSTLTDSDYRGEKIKRVRVSPACLAVPNAGIEVQIPADIKKLLFTITSAGIFLSVPVCHFNLVKLVSSDTVFKIF